MDKQTHFGGEVKALGEGKVGGYLVRFGGVDLDGDTFTADTYFGKAEGNGQDLTFHHRYPIIAQVDGKEIAFTELADHIFANPIKTERRDDIGLWAEAVLDMHNDYEKMVYELAERGVLGWSSGSAGHMIRFNDNVITSWPIIEGALTPTPAEPRNVAAVIKALQARKTHVTDSDDTTPEAQPEANPAADAVDVTGADVKSNPMSEVTVMSEQEQPLANTDATKRVDALEAKLNTMSTDFSKKLDDLLQVMQDTPAIRNAGGFAVDGGASDPQIKSLGDYFLAVKRGDTKRLQTVYKSTKDMTSEDGSAGGWTVPAEHSQELFQMAFNNNSLLGIIPKQYVGTNSGDFPVLDQYITPTAGTGQVAGGAGMKATERAEGGGYTESQPAFRVIPWRVNSIGNIVQASRELVADSSLAIDSFIRSMASLVIDQKMIYYVLRGNGNGQPLGILDSSNGAIVDVDPDTGNVFVWDDAVEMVSRLKVLNPNTVRWVMHQSMMTDLGAFQTGTNDGVLNVLKEGRLMSSILTYMIEYSEHMPQADQIGSVMLIDFSAYRLFIREQMSVAYSEHYAFGNGLGTWRIDARVDGKPVVVDSITQADPQGSYTVSPFVRFLDD